MLSRDYRILFNSIEVPVKLSNGEYVVPINLDNAATTPPLKNVDTFLYDNILMYGSVGRGGQKSSYCTQAYEVSRQEILNFFGLTQEDGYTVIYVKNTTEGLNLLAHTLCEHPMDKILTTRMEHHANDLPWRMVGKTLYVDVNKQGRFDLENIKEWLEKAQKTIKYVSVTAASNVTGYVNPIHEIARLVHQYGAKIIVDGAQLVAHRDINIKGTGKDDAIDFLVFSGHKMYAPFGNGVIIGLKEVLEAKNPYLVGGGTVVTVLDQDIYWKETPWKNEAGTPNFLGAMAIVAAMVALKEVGFDQIRNHEDELKAYLLKALEDMPGIVLYGDSKDKNRLGVVSFNIEGMYHEEVANLLANKRGIALRSGCFCAQPYVARLLGVSDEERYQYMLDPTLRPVGMLRASLGLYNTKEEIDVFLNTLEDVIRGR